MSADPTRELIRELASDLAPVKPLPRLRFVALAVALLWLTFSLAGIALKGFAPTFWQTLALPLGAGGIFASLLAGGLGGTAGALALAIPGRERLARGALALGAAGMLVAACIGAAQLAQSPLAGWRMPDRYDLPCLVTALGIGLAPGLALAWFGGRAAPFRPLTFALAAAAGAAALGGSAATATCSSDEAMHLLVGHALTPALGVFVLALPLLVALRRSDQRAPH